MQAFAAKFETAVLNNHISLDPLWQKECLAYNLQFVFPAETQTRLTDLQSQIQDFEPSALLRCPAESLHVSILRLIAVRHEYSRDKDQIWAEHRERCLSALREITEDAPPFIISFQQIVATDAAVIALADDDGSLQRLRASLLAKLPSIEGWRDNTNMIHTTLFRYASRLHDPRRFLTHLSNLGCDLSVLVDEVRLRKELVYPSLASEPLATFRLNG